MSDVILKKENRKRVDWFMVFTYLSCGAFAFVCLFPMYYVLVGSLSPIETFSSSAITLIPKGISFQYYHMVLSTRSFTQALLMSALKTLTAVAGMITITSCLAYAVSKSQLKGMKFLNLYVIFTMYFGGTIIQSYLLYRDLHMLDTMAVLTVPAFVDTWTFIVMRNYFANNVPAELEQAAAIDGANEMITFFRVVIPISKPVFAAMILFAAVSHWNDWATYTYYCQGNTSLKPFVRLLQDLLEKPDIGTAELAGAGYSKMPPPTALKYTVIMCAMLPIMTVYPFLQKYFAHGIMVGALKE